MKIKNKLLFVVMIPVLIIQIYFIIPDINFFLMAESMPAIMYSLLTFDLIVMLLLIKLFTTTIDRGSKDE